MRVPAFPGRPGDPDRDFDQGSEWDDFLDSADVAFKLTGRDEIARTSRELLGEAQQEWMSSDTVLRQSPPDRAPVAERTEALGRGIRVRALFDVPFTRQPLGRQFLRSRAAAGEEVRLGRYVPFRLQIADLQACLIWSSPEDEDHARVVYSPAHVAGIRSCFELLWSTSWDYECKTAGDSAKPTPEQLVLARLLTLDLDEEEIAWASGTTVTQVREEIKDLQRLVGAGNEFQLGAELDKRGWSHLHSPPE